MVSGPRDGMQPLRQLAIRGVYTIVLFEMTRKRFSPYWYTFLQALAA